MGYIIRYILEMCSSIQECRVDVFINSKNDLSYNVEITAVANLYSY